MSLHEPLSVVKTFGEQMFLNVSKSFTFDYDTPVQSILNLPMSVQCWLSSFIAAHILCAIFAYLDYYKLARKYKFTTGNDDKDLTYIQLLPVVLRNQIFIYLPMMYFSEYFGFCYPSGVEDRMPIWKWPISVAMMSMGHEIGVYTGHRFLLHSTWGYKLFSHDVHHSTRSTVAVSAFYMSVCDYIIEVVLPILIPLSLTHHYLGVSSGWNYFIMTLGNLGGFYVHSGYNFWPYEPAGHWDTTAHFEHHKKYLCSFADGFGSLSLYDDYLCKTSYRFFNAKVAEKRAKKMQEKNGLSQTEIEDPDTNTQPMKHNAEETGHKTHLSQLKELIFFVSVALIAHFGFGLDY